MATQEDNKTKFTAENVREEIAKRLEKYKLPKDLDEAEKRVVDMLDGLGYSEMDKAAQIRALRRWEESKRSKPTTELPHDSNDSKPET